DQMARESVMYPEIELPLWVRLGETLPNDWITDRMLKTDLVYTSAQRSTEWFSVPSTTWVETKKHDPFVILGTMITKTSLSDEDRISILRSISDSRHRSHERLWSGDNLVTSNIVTDIDIYRDHHLAYTEKYLDIKNMSTRNRWWGNTEEALYTFRMPEGSVVTSLSLWVNGKEEKAILTSKGKATEAYETIVGKERRDPSVVHWQEGNTVVVRVFPCTPSEQRKVKIGFTSPLRETDGSLRYQNITFEGPSANEAKETVRVRIVGDRTLQLEGFRQDTNGDWISENDYDPDFEISVPATALKVNNRFSFLGNSYHVEKYVPTYEDVTIENIFLDINSSWTNSEVDACRDLVGQRSIYVYHNNNFVPITSENWDIVEQLRSRNYSLFPIHRLKQAPESLVITKGSAISPHLADLKETAFANSMNRFFAKGRKIRVFNFGEESSNFISSLRELRALSFATGDEKELARIVSGKFPINQESENQVVLHDAALKIVQVPQADQSEPSGGPDHLYRLFAYNNIMRQAGPFYFGKADPKGLVEDAARAYVVSPFSSLIVLETQQDYDRFGIKDIDNSLKNASKQSSGAVPEPHEWALIMLCVLVALYVKFRR
ncbi:MAG TPA: XrtN system VIT domain-containing protein, partial [Sphingobacteriaceae bacterium]